jgi:zinc and cadmium transporter
MQIQVLLLIYCVLIVASSLLGGFAPQLIRLTHRRMQLMMSLVGGLMLGVALLHLLPHSVAEQGSLDRAALWTLFGLLFMFLLIRVFHVHAHEHGDVSDVVGEGHGAHEHHGHAHSHGHGHSHGHSHGHGHGDHDHHDCDSEHAPAVERHRLSWVGLAFGLSLHTLIDGLALGAAVAAESHESHGGWMLFGLGTFLAVALHKPLDALSITSLMAAGGWSKQAAWTANFIFSLMCPLGALLFVLGVSRWVEGQALVVGCALAFAAGVFLCISLADLLPEVTFHTHDRFRLTACLLAGVLLAWGIGFLEPEHSHGHGHNHAAHSHTPPKQRASSPSKSSTQPRGELPIDK